MKIVIVDGGWWQRYRDYVPRPLQGFKIKTRRFDALQLPFNELRREACRSKEHDQAAHPDRSRDCGGELYCSRHLFSIYSHRRQALASRLRSCCLLLALESEIPVRGSGPRNPRLPTHGKAVYGGYRLTSTRCKVLDPCGKGFIAIKSPGTTS